MSKKELAVKAAKEAGKTLMDYYGNLHKIIEKSPNNYVTEADLASEKLVIDMIKKNFPDHEIISEEAGKINSSDHVWHIDPLDGTHNFMHQIPFFGVSIAYAYKGEVQLGVIYCPYVGDLYVAEKGKGAFCNGKKIAVSDKDRVRNFIIIFDGALHKKTDLKFGLLRELVKRCHRIRLLGAAVYQCISVAIGGAEGYIELSTNSWDVAAGLLLIREAGGRVTGFDNKDWKIGTKEFVASNGKHHEEFLDIVNKK